MIRLIYDTVRLILESENHCKTKKEHRFAFFSDVSKIFNKNGLIYLTLSVFFLKSQDFWIFFKLPKICFQYYHQHIIKNDEPSLCSQNKHYLIVSSAQTRFIIFQRLLRYQLISQRPFSPFDDFVTELSRVSLQSLLGCAVPPAAQRQAGLEIKAVLYKNLWKSML